MGNNIIEKAKHNLGDTKVYNGKTYYVAGFNTKGAPLWRQQKTGAPAAKTAAPAPSSTSSSSGNKQAPAATPAPSKNPAPSASANTPAAKTAAPAKEPYDAPKAKVTYKQAPAKEINYRVPKSWMAMSRAGSLTKFERSALRVIYADKNKVPDDKLLKLLNNHNNNENVRMLAYEEAAARGIPESKIDVSGTLKKDWDRKKEKYDMMHSDSDSDELEEEFITYDMSGLGDMDVKGFMAQFPNGDTGWAEKDDKRVQKEFNNFLTLSDRQRYDAFTDFQKRQDPLYASPRQQLQGLNRQLFHFMNSGNRPMMVSAGGAGAGKTTGMLKVANLSALTIYDKNKHKPGDGDYDIFIVDKDVEDEKEFRKIIEAHNGKIIVFDDKDKLLTSTASSLVSLMKSLADGNPDMRMFQSPSSGNQEKFTGKLLFITNKTMDKLQKDEDHKAIMSRADKNDIHFTINENIEILRDRYKTMGKKMKHVKDEAKVRQEIFDIIVNNTDKLDPDKFTVRKFEDALEYVDGTKETNELSKNSDDAEEAFGKEINWKKYIMGIFNKAEETDIEKALPPYSNTKETGMDMDEESKKKMLKMYKKNPSRFKELFGDEIVELLNGDSEKDESVNKVEKAMDNFIGEMSLEEAESILFK